MLFAVSRRGKPILAPAPIGLEVAGARLGGTPRVTTFAHDFSAEVPFHTVRAHIDLKANCAAADFGDLSLTILSTDQGVAYRWTIVAAGEAEIRDETFTFAPAGEPELLYGYNPAGYRGDHFQGDFESTHNRSALGKIDPKRLIYLPVTLLGDDVALALAEAEVRDYPGLNLRRPIEPPGRLVAAMARFPAKVEATGRQRLVVARESWLVRTPGPRALPWRIFMLADNAAGLYGNDLVMALSEPAQGDFSWVKPGACAWEWWNAFGLDDTPFKPGINTETYRAYIDFAADLGLPYALIDSGWSQGDDLLKVAPGLDLPALLAYAKKRNVGLVLWADWGALYGRQDALFAHYARMGVKGFKIDHFDRDDAAIARFLRETAALAAKHRLVLDYHGIHKPTGLSRTFPNVLTYEGILGLETAKWAGNDLDFITNDLRIPFTRLLAGPADYTPGAMRNATRQTFRPNVSRPMSMGTRCRQAALLMLLDTNFRVFCDSPSAYAREPAYTRFLADLPLTWDDTRCDPASAPDALLLVRRRKGDAHWIAAIVGPQARDLAIPLADLVPGVTYTATILRDSPVSDAVPTDYILQTRTVTAQDTLTLPCAPGGGFLIRLTPSATP